MFPEQARKNLAITPPRAFVSGGGGQGQVATLAVSTTAIAIDLTQGFNRVAPTGTAQGSKPLVETRNALTIWADAGADLGVIFGASVAAVSTANAPSLSAVGTLNFGKYTGTSGTCFRIPAGTSARFILAQGVDNALGIVASASGVVRLYQSSPDDA